MVLPLIGAVGAAAGGIGALGSMFRKPKSTASAAPWGPAQGYLRNNLSAAESLYNSGGFRTDPYMGERVAPYSAMTQSGMDMLGRVQGAEGYGRGALDSMLNMDETYRDFDTIRKTVGDQTQARLSSVFAGGGINSGLAQDTFSRGMGEALAGVEYGAYNDAQARRLAALGLAPEFQGMDMRAAGARLTGGGLQDDLAQRRIDADMMRQREMEDADMEALMRYSGLVQGIGGMGGTSESTTPRSMTDWGNLFSGAGTALSAGATLFGNRTPATAAG